MPKIFRTPFRNNPPANPFTLARPEHRDEEPDAGAQEGSGDDYEGIKGSDGVTGQTIICPEHICRYQIQIYSMIRQVMDEKWDDFLPMPAQLPFWGVLGSPLPCSSTTAATDGLECSHASFQQSMKTLGASELHLTRYYLIGGLGGNIFKTPP
ncbi:hypothetical protein DFH09DRAFT_1274760 [Mycena vulgaris]|nr:hypothetical protein DFH09DRAFT_1274760 [Mycena vulgaris]